MLAHLSAVPFVDGHMHPPLTDRPTTPSDFAWPWYEGDDSYREIGRDLVTYRSAVRDLAALLETDPTEDALLAAIGSRTHEQWIEDCCRLGAVSGLVIDTGFPLPPAGVDAPDLIAAAGVDGCWLTRIELVAEQVIPHSTSLGDFRERQTTALAAALDDGASGLKSIVAYRTGLGVGALDEASAAGDLAALQDRAAAGERPRVEAKALNDLLVHDALALCRERGCPLQLHAGYGDRDIDLRLGDPLLFKGVLESGAADGVPIVFLHCAYPFTKQTAVLTANYRDVYLDIATCIPPLGHAALVDAYRIAIAVSPITRVQSSSDAAGVIEQVPVAAVRARRAVAAALAESYGAGEITAREVDEIAEAFLGGNARRIYFGVR